MDSTFEYKITVNKFATIVTFSGKICKDALDKLEQCRGDLAPVGSRTVVIYFKDVTGVEVAAYRHLTIIQREIRKKSNLYCVGLSPELKNLLTAKAILRPTEFRRSLEEALKAA